PSDSEHVSLGFMPTHWAILTTNWQTRVSTKSRARHLDLAPSLCAPEACCTRRRGGNGISDCSNSQTKGSPCCGPQASSIWFTRERQNPLRDVVLFPDQSLIGRPLQPSAFHGMTHGARDACAGRTFAENLSINHRLAYGSLSGGFMRRMTTALVLGAAFLLSVAPAYAQRWGRGATPAWGVFFYEDITYGGRYFCSAAGTSTPQVSSGNNDEISSIRLFGDAVATVYRDPNFRGQSRVIDSSVSDLRSLGFNDRISSYQVDTGRGNWSRDARGFPNNGRIVQPNASRWSYR